MKEMYRQGDLLLIKRQREPDGEIDKTNVLMEGSVTGHNHKVEGGIVYKRTIDWNGVFAYVEVETEAKLVHDEHDTIILSSGVYEVRRQREIDGYVED